MALLSVVFEISVGGVDGNSGEQFVHCVINDMECSCDAGNKVWDFGFGRYFPCWMTVLTSTRN